MAPDPRVMAHERETERSYKNLSIARLDAARTRPGGYNSQAYRTLLHEEFKKRLPGMEPYEWQLDVSEALFLGLDCTVIAGTGSGKTMPFVMPLFAAKDKVFGGKDKDMVIIISPLNALEAQDVRQRQEVNSKTAEEVDAVCGCVSRCPLPIRIAPDLSRRGFLFVPLF
ncbi:hypothetical protein D9758_017687 [Tetrapyrgos nigripes]|uniref:DEAD/DEAH-box helicase domain-containing protein n=1 Tax=Tetrapyrgos nigripes TaxID=182062 RepID=A0A8H5FGH1_9AGAR|nr:hypothetical protein D9758_017687 [Tetrapyrgos nigripes]